MVPCVPGQISIEGVQIIPLRTFTDERGTVYHMLKATDPHFRQFGEVYFSSVNAGVIKAWKNHRRVIVNFACILGRIKLVLYDDRDDSPTKGQVMEVLLGPDNYALAVIPPGVWNGFRGLSQPHAIIASCATEPHDSAEFIRLDPTDRRIPYTW